MPNRSCNPDDPTPGVPAPDDAESDEATTTRSVRWEPAVPVEVPDAARHIVRVGPGPGWEVAVALPPRRVRDAVGPGPYPALYLVDGWLTFVVAAQITRTTLEFSLGQLRPVVVVGIGPESRDPDRLVARHVRDLTPTSAMPRHLVGRASYGTGGAEATLALIRDVIAPHLESVHPLDPTDRGLGGVSLGGMFACWSVLARPSGFRRALAVSPSVYWDDELLLDEQRLPAVAAGQRDVYLAVGEREDGPDRQWPATPPQMREHVETIDLVAGLRRLAARLEDIPRLTVRSEVIADEQHSTIWPAAFTRGLVHLYGTA